MVTYSKLGAKIWKLVDYFEPAVVRHIDREAYEALDREILQWYETVPDPVRIKDFDRELPLPSTPSYNLQRLQIWTRLRLNQVRENPALVGCAATNPGQIRIWLHTPVLHSAGSIQANLDLAHTAVHLARDTIQYLDRLNNHTNLYRKLQVFYHQFLTSAISVLFLASTHAPLQFSASCRSEFSMALELVKDMSPKSFVSQRLWRTIRSLKAYAPRVGLQVDEPTSNEVMNPVLPMQPFAQSGGPSPPGATPRQPRDDRQNGLDLQSEMTKIFGGYMGISGVPLPPEGFLYGRGASAHGPADDEEGFVHEGGVYGQLRNMF